MGDDGTLTTRGRLRAVLRLRGAADRAAVATLEALAGAINALPGEVTLLCLGMSGGLAAAVGGAPALALAEGEHAGRTELARSQAEHLAA